MQRRSRTGRRSATPSARRTSRRVERGLRLPSSRSLSPLIDLRDIDANAALIHPASLPEPTAHLGAPGNHLATGTAITAAVTGVRIEEVRLLTEWHPLLVASTAATEGVHIEVGVEVETVHPTLSGCAHLELHAPLLTDPPSGLFIDRLGTL